MRGASRHLARALAVADIAAQTSAVGAGSERSAASERLQVVASDDGITASWSPGTLVAHCRLIRHVTGQTHDLNEKKDPAAEATGPFSFDSR